MAVEKMHFSMPMATGFEGSPFTPFQAEQEAFTVKARAEQGPFTVKARAEQEAPILKVKVKKAKPEVKAKVKVETMTTEEEEALIKFVAELEKEEAFLDAKAEAEKQAGCGSKRKTELERDAEGAAFVARIEAMKPPTDRVEYSDGDVSDGYDSQDDPEANFGRVMARYERHIQANNARWPFLVGA